MVDARNYASKRVGPDQVRHGPITTCVVNVYEDERFNRLQLELEDGSQFALNGGNTSVLVKAWGHDTDGWLGRQLTLELGKYMDWKADPPEEKDTVRVRATPPAEPAPAGNGGAPAGKPSLPSGKAAAKKPPEDDLDDSVPFALAFIVASAVTWLAAGGNALIA